MTDDLNAWISFYYLLGSDTLKPAAAWLLRQGAATGADLEIINMLDGVYATWRKEKAAAG